MQNTSDYNCFFSSSLNTLQNLFCIRQYAHFCSSDLFVPGEDGRKKSFSMCIIMHNVAEREKWFRLARNESCKHNHYSFCNWKPSESAASRERSCWWRRKRSWLQNKQEKWEEIYAIRVFHSNSLHSVGLGGWDEKHLKHLLTVSILCLHYLIVFGPCMRNAKRKLSHRRGNNLEINAYVDCSAFDGDFESISRVEGKKRNHWSRTRLAESFVCAGEAVPMSVSMETFISLWILHEAGVVRAEK